MTATTTNQKSIRGSLATVPPMRSGLFVAAPGSLSHTQEKTMITADQFAEIDRRAAHKYYLRPVDEDRVIAQSDSLAAAKKIGRELMLVTYLVIRSADGALVYQR